MKKITNITHILLAAIATGGIGLPQPLQAQSQPPRPTQPASLAQSARILTAVLAYQSEPRPVNFCSIGKFFPADYFAGL
ncbi:MAG TPA: hypothetical protein VKQ52_07490 [Puia sp.]|nr:hypothetical protein [Puia sp.]